MKVYLLAVLLLAALVAVLCTDGEEIDTLEQEQQDESLEREKRRYIYPRLSSQSCRILQRQCRSFCKQRTFLLCEGGKGGLSCPPGEKIVVIYANYGRTTGSSVCPHSHIRTTNCRSGGAKIRKMCNGRNSCFLQAKNGVFGDPCRGTYKYIEVKYLCI